MIASSPSVDASIRSWNPLRITRVETLDIRIPLDRVRADAVNVTDSWGFPTVRLHTDSGLVGTGYSSTAKGAGNDLIVLTVQNYYAQRLLGRDPQNISGIWNDLYWSPLHWSGRSGISHMALAAVDIALWDLAAQSAGLALCDLLGGRDDDRFPAYDTNGGWLSFSIDELVSNARTAVDAGFGAIKMKVGGGDGAEDIRRVEAVRHAIGDGIGLMVDANQAWAPHHASYWGRRLSGSQVRWLEEPLFADDWRAHRQLADEIETPIAVGEHLYTRSAFSDFIAAGAVAYVQPDVTRLGGITEFRQVAELAAAHGLPVCPHAGDMRQIHQHMVFSTETAFLFESIPWGSHLFEHPAKIEEGFLRRPTAPGAGTAMIESEVERYAVARWESAAD
jgi:L-alanine-DL-glutamate epimerase-like enolase superfamily enzyme